MIQWVERNAKIFRLANPVDLDAAVNVGNIKYCSPGEHYWHFVGNTNFIRKFYVLRKNINTSLEKIINSIPQEKCPDVINQDKDREGYKVDFN